MALLFRGQRGGEQARILAFEDMFVVKNERLVELDQLFGADQVALRLGKRRLSSCAAMMAARLMPRDHSLLHGNRQALVALLRNWNGFKLHLQPVVNALLRPVVLAMRQSRQFDAAAHVHRIDRRSRQLVQPRVLALRQTAAAISVMPRQTMSTGITSRHFRSFEGSWRKFVPSK